MIKAEARGSVVFRGSRSTRWRLSRPFHSPILRHAYQEWLTTRLAV